MGVGCSRTDLFKRGPQREQKQTGKAQVHDAPTVAPARLRHGLGAQLLRPVGLPRRLRQVQVPQVEGRVNFDLEEIKDAVVLFPTVALDFADNTLIVAWLCWTLNVRVE